MYLYNKIRKLIVEKREEKQFDFLDTPDSSHWRQSKSRYRVNMGGIGLLLTPVH